MTDTQFLFRQSKTNPARYTAYLANEDTCVGFVTRRQVPTSGKRDLTLWTAKTIAGRVVGNHYSTRQEAAEALTA